MLGKVVLLAGAGAAYALLSPEARARLSRLLGDRTGGPPTASEPAALPAGGTSAGSAGSLLGERTRPRVMQAVRRGSSDRRGTVPPLVDRRPQGDAGGEGIPDEMSGAHLLPDARPVEIARAVSEEQSSPGGPAVGA